MKPNAMNTILSALALVILLGGCYMRRSEPFRGPLDKRTASINNGERKFNEYCQKCHPSGEAGLGPGLNWLPVPRFVIAFQIRHGLGVMPAFKRDELSKQDLWDITKYMKALKRNSKGQSAAAAP
jgi:mono/diheme cytochrome c family protein